MTLVSELYNQNKYLFNQNNQGAGYLMMIMK